jgi:hypothetical protein
VPNLDPSLTFNVGLSFGNWTLGSTMIGIGLNWYAPKLYKVYLDCELTMGPIFQVAEHHHDFPFSTHLKHCDVLQQ